MGDENERPTDQDIHDKQQAALDAEREEHNRRMTSEDDSSKD